MSDSVRPHRRQPTRLCRPQDSPGKNTGVGCHFLLQIMKVKVKSLSRVQLFATPWTAAYQAPLSMGFSRQEYWSGLPLPSPLSIPGSEENKGKVILKDRFLTQSAPDIHCKLLNQAYRPNQSLDNLLQLPQTVYYSKEYEENKGRERQRNWWKPF